MTALAVAAVVIVALAIPALRHLRETPPPAPAETRLEIVTPGTDRPMDFALSPDGRQIVFVASGDGASRLWRRSLATTTAEPLAGTEGAQLPFWAPDGRAVRFFADGQLNRDRPAGRRAADHRSRHLRPGVSRSVQGNTDLWLLDGARTSRFTFDAAGDILPLWSRDGRRIVYGATRTGPPACT